MTGVCEDFEGGQWGLETCVWIYVVRENNGYWNTWEIVVHYLLLRWHYSPMRTFGCTTVECGPSVALQSNADLPLLNDPLPVSSVFWPFFPVVNFTLLNVCLLAVLSKAWVFGRSLARIVGSNPTGGMDVCVELVVSTVAWNVKVTWRTKRI
jgi:hypothetical protein